MKKFESKSAFSILFWAFLAISACSPRLTPFDRSLYERGNFSDQDLQKVQFFLSEDLVLERDAEQDGATKIDGGRINIENGRSVEVVRIRRGTAGIFLFRPESDHFAVAFEDGDDSKFLIFGPNPKRSGQYTLLASDWKNRRASVTYAGQKFQASGEAAFATLLVDLKKIRNTEVNSRTAHGRRL